MKVKKIIVFLLVSFIFTECHKDEDSTYVLVSNEFKEWTIFQKNSYWIYYNANTLKTDCTFVTNCERSLYAPDPPHKYYVESFYVRFNSAFLSNFHIIAGDGPYTQQSIDEYHALGLGLTTGRLENPFVQFGYIDPMYKSKVVEIIPNLILNNNSFNNVYNILWAWKNTNGDSVVENYYLAKYFGLIKFRTSIGNHDTTWSLLRYNIIQL